MRLVEKLKNLPMEPGVYQMRGSDGEILYVGKAKNLKNRVSSYFQQVKNHTPKTRLLVTKIKDIEVVITDSEVEALILEFNLIKKFKPRFNIRLKDDKSYPYVRLDVKHPFPRLEYVRRVKKDGARYFGPYVSALQIKDVLRWSQKAFMLRDCSDNEFRNRVRPCILHQMGQCSAPCVAKISEKDYHAAIEDVLRILDGKTKDVIREMRAEMKKVSAEERYEYAAILRDRIASLKALVSDQDQKMLDPESEKDRDVLQIARKGTVGVVVVLSVRGGVTIGVQQYPFTEMDEGMDDSEFLYEFLTQYYLERYESAPKLLPKEVLVPEFLETHRQHLGVLASALGKTVTFRVPKRGELAELVAMVKKTADYHVLELTTKKASSVKDLIDVQKRLSLQKFPRRIECFDISHFQGEGTVASRVVFIDGRPDKNLYRHYHVREVDGIDDFKSMHEILSRRFLNDPDLPDLVVIDGGRGQLAQVLAVFSELQVQGVDLVSIAKARTESDFTATEVKATMERIFKPNQKNPVMLKPGTGAYRALVSARDEAHRFAITFHRKVRDADIKRN